VFYTILIIPEDHQPIGFKKGHKVVLKPGSFHEKKPPIYGKAGLSVESAI